VSSFGRDDVSFLLVVKNTNCCKLIWVNREN
jgi:hypothetical protein